MLKRAYIVNFDKGGVNDNFDYKKFHDSLTTKKGLITWWHYLESSYILIVEPTVLASKVGEIVRQLAPNKRVFICELNLSNHDGWLPKEAWDWISKYR